MNTFELYLVFVCFSRVETTNAAQLGAQLSFHPSTIINRPRNTETHGEGLGANWKPFIGTHGRAASKGALPKK